MKGRDAPVRVKKRHCLSILRRCLGMMPVLGWKSESCGTRRRGTCLVPRMLSRTMLLRPPRGLRLVYFGLWTLLAATRLPPFLIYGAREGALLELVESDLLITGKKT